MFISHIIDFSLPGAEGHDLDAPVGSPRNNVMLSLSYFAKSVPACFRGDKKSHSGTPKWLIKPILNKLTAGHRELENELKDTQKCQIFRQ